MSPRQPAEDRRPPRMTHRPGAGLVWARSADELVRDTTARWARWAANNPRQLSLPIALNH